MKQAVLLFLTVFLSFCQMDAQNQPAEFAGAPATLETYKALFILNEADDKKIKGLLGNISNALDDPRIKEKLQAELIVFSDGVALYKKSNGYEKELRELQHKGVLLALCENTVKSRNIDKSDLLPFISYVPSAMGEIIIRQAEGWVAVHP